MENIDKKRHKYLHEYSTELQYRFRYVLLELTASSGLGCPSMNYNINLTLCFYTKQVFR